jgi:hypothetical protein
LKNLIDNSAITRLQAIVCVVIITASIAVGAYGFNIGNIRYGPGPVEIELTTDKPFYLQGEEVNFTITVNNPQDWPVPYPNVVEYRIGNQSVWQFMTLPLLVPLFPAHSGTLYATCSVTPLFGPMPLGNYTLNVSFSGPVDWGSGGNCTFEIRPNP